MISVDSSEVDGVLAHVVGWSMQSRQTTDVVPHALLTAVWRRKPKNKALIHSDQRSQFAGMGGLHSGGRQ